MQISWTKNLLVNFYAELPDNKLQTIPILDYSITPEPYNFIQHIDAIHTHHHKRRQRFTCGDRYLLFMLDTSGSIGRTTFTMHNGFKFI